MSFLSSSQHGLDLICALDRHLLTWGPLLVGAIEGVALCWVYGVQKWAGNMEVMLGTGPSVWWTYSWKFVIPLVHMVSAGSEKVRLIVSRIK